jgi:hypothetical protein
MSEATKDPQRTWSRFSIRAMMAFVLVVAVLLGWKVNRAREQREAVAAVESAGGWVHYDYELVGGKVVAGRGPRAPRWLRK